MTAPATALGLEFVQVEELHYGKLVAALGGHVPLGEDYATTYQTRGLLHPDRVLPKRLLEGTLLQPNHVEEPFRRAGALFFRMIDGTLVAMRARYRPEAGEGRPGRTYLQARIFQIQAPRGFASVPPALIPWVGGQDVDPDLITTPAAKRLGVAPLEVPFDSTLIVTPARLDSMGPKERIRIPAIIHAMRHAAPLVVGDDGFDDPCQRLKVFLTDVELALTVMAQCGQQVSSNFQIACGLSPEIAVRSLALSSVERSTQQSAVKWDDVVRMVELAARPVHPLSRQIALGERATTQRWSTLQSQETFRRRATVSANPESAARQMLPVRNGYTRAESSAGARPDRRSNADPSNIAPKPNNICSDKEQAHADVRDNSVLSALHGTRGNSTPTRQTEALNDFGVIFKQVRDKWSRPASLELFRFASDRCTHGALKNWNPFDLADPAQQEVLLALLMGVYGRGDLLDSFSLTEFCSVWSYLEMIDTRENPNYLDRLIRCIDHRISDLGMLTRNELKAIGTYRDRYGADSFSNNTPRRLTADAEYYCCIDSVCSSDSAYLDLEKRQIIEGGLRRIVNRLDCFKKMNAKDPKHLVFCSSTIEPDPEAIFRLPQRQQVIQESNFLFRHELTTARDVLAQFGKG